ncbi:MAG: hypothetical protein B6I35_11565 [Anaerolineaceae bacterium 4572_32.2]|nr:MAG: hypothetical protein B6I35_11565 [Anaerolineaceae bacterium 4572_32.2]
MRPSESRRALWLMVGILLLGAALRFVALEHSPPGLAPDEATNGYDAYSIALTGRDQHGNFLPTVMVSLNDYRMPAFIYAAVPFVAALGLSVTSVRMAAAACGWLTLPLIYWLGARMFDRPAGLVAALLLALSPWHLPFSRMGLEGTVVVLLVTSCVAAFWKWRAAGHRWRWALLAAIIFGLSLYGYAIMKLFTPLLAVGLGLLFWPDFKAHWRQGLVMICVIGLMALPVISDTLRMSELMQARYNQIAVFSSSRPLKDGVAEALSNWWVHISPQYLFARGDMDMLQHPPGGGQLYWAQLPLLLIALAGGALLPKQRRVSAVLVLWIALSGIPVALTHLNAPGSGHSLRSIQAVVPWQILSAAGFALAWNMRRKWRAALVLFLIVGLAAQAVPYLRYYFTGYPAKVALRFDDGMPQAAQAMDVYDDDYDFVGFTDQASWPYLHILFFTRYDPRLLQLDLPARGPEMFAPVTRVGKYHIGDVERMYHEMEHGLFVMPEWMLPGVEPLAITCRSNGAPAFKIVGK